MPPSAVPLRPSAASMAAVSRSMGGWGEGGGEDGGVLVAASAALSPWARVVGLPIAWMWVHQIAGDGCSRWLSMTVRVWPTVEATGFPSASVAAGGLVVGRLVSPTRSAGAAAAESGAAERPGGIRPEAARAANVIRYRAVGRRRSKDMRFLLSG